MEIQNTPPAALPVTLSKFKPADSAALVRWLNEKEIYDQTLLIPHPYTEQDGTWWIKHVTDLEKVHGRQKVWALREPSGMVVGGIGLQYKYGLDAHKDEFGYWLAKPYWNQGLMTRVVQQFTEFCFTQRRLVRLEATVFAHNGASARVLEKAGFQKEGILKKYHLKDGKIFDGILFARTT